MRRIADKFDETNQRVKALEDRIAQTNHHLLEQEKMIRILEERLSTQMRRADCLENDGELLFKHVLNENDASALAKLHTAAALEKAGKPRLAVYTVLIGEYDTLHAPVYIDANCDYFCFTNIRGLTSPFWKVIYVENDEGLDSIRFQRKLKLSAHLLFPEYTHSLYVDTSIQIHKSIWDWIERFSTGKPFLAYRHPDRDCIYAESEACINLGKDSREIIMAQMERYRQCGYPEKNGLIWGAILYRKHHDQAVIRVHQTWLEEIMHGSRRDQLSFNYACWKNGFSYDEATGDYRDYFLWAYCHDEKFR